MLRTGLFISATLAYLGLFGCTLLSRDGSAASAAGETGPRRFTPASLPNNVVASTDGYPYRSATIQIQRTDWIDKYKQSIDEIAAIGCDTVKIVVDARQENGTSSRIYLDLRMTPTPESLGDLIRYARGKGLRVVLMPIVLLDAPRTDEWRGKIAPESWPTWWKSYREVLNHFAWIAEGNGVDILVVGSELVSTENRLDDWIETIDGVRKIFKGRLTYSANWDHYANIGFWDRLDLVAMNSYWKLGTGPAVSVAEIKKNWARIQGELFAFHKKTGKPIMFMEVGWCSMSNAAHEPWDYTTGDPVDDELQKKLYEGFFETWYGVPWLAGFSIWEWPPTPEPNDTEGIAAMKRGYTPEGKPAENILRDWLAKPWTR